MSSYWLEIVSGPLRMWGPLALSLVALACAWMAHAQGQRMSEHVVLWNDLLGRVDSIRQRAAHLHPTPASDLPQAPRGESEVEAKGRAKESAKEFAPPTEVDLKSEATLEEIDGFRALLAQLLSAAAVPSEPMDPAIARFNSFSDRLAAATELEQVSMLGDEFRAGLPDLMRRVISRCDRDLDPERSNGRIQEPLMQMLRAAGLDVLEPAVGAPFDENLHTRLGVYKKGSPDRRGTIGLVRCRGLRLGQGEILLKPEVLEYD